MRRFKVLSVFAVCIMCASSVFPSERVGLEQLKKMQAVGFESGNYRVDPDFKLGYGDTVVVNLWGKLEGSYKLTIERDGSVFLPITGKVYLLGLSMDEARAAVKRELDKKYTNVELDVILADVRDIRVTVLGNAQKAGVYSMSPFSQITDAIIKSGCPNDKGSVSDIRLIRDDKEIATFNIYDFIINGNQNVNLRLKHGDVIFIPLLKDLVEIKGNVANPGKYEIAGETRLGKAIGMTGGILPSESPQKIYVMRVDPKYSAAKLFKEIFLEKGGVIKKEDDIPLKNEDVIIITNASDFTLYPEAPYKTVFISGKVGLPGIYLAKEDETLGSLIKKAGGLKEDAFIEGAIFTRPSLIEKERPVRNELINGQQKAILVERADLADVSLPLVEKEARAKALEYRQKALDIIAARSPKGRIIMDLEDIISQKTDIRLMEGDSIEIPVVPEWVMVTGAVYNPESIIFSDGKGIDYYLGAVGLNRLADREEIYIIKPNGHVKTKAAGYGTISRGDIIVVPEKIR